MALTQGSQAAASDFNSIRTRVIAEFNTSSRRNVGSNYSAPAAAVSAGGSIAAANVNNIAKDLYYVNSSTYTSNGISSGTTITANMNAINTALTTYEGKAKVGSDSGCKSGCIGLCQGCSGTCTGGCTSCTSCSGTCSGSCSGGCTGCTSCSGGCSGCTGGCTNNCTSVCLARCDKTCCLNCKIDVGLYG